MRKNIYFNLKSQANEKISSKQKDPPTCTFTIIHLYSEHLCHSNKQLQNQVVANLEKPNFLIVMLVWKIDKCSTQEKDIHEQLSMTKHPQTRGLLINCFVGTEEGLLSELTDKRAFLVRKTLLFPFSNPRAICIAYSAFCPSRHKKDLFRKSIANV